VTHGGFVVFDNSIARFADDHGTYRWAQMLLREDVEVPQKEVDQFVKAVGASSTALRIEWPGDVRWQEQREPLRATLELEERRDGSMMGMPRFYYGAQMISAFRIAGPIYDETSRTVYLRDAAGERRRVEILWALGFRKYGDAVTFPVEQLAAVLPKLIEAGWEVSGADGTYAAPGELELTVTSNIDWFDMNGAVDFGTERVKLPRLLTALRRGDSMVKLSDGRVGVMRPEWLEQLEPLLAAAAEEQKEGVRFRRNQVLLLDVLLRSRPEVAFDEVFEAARRRILDLKVVPEQPPASFRGTLRPYQSEGLGWFSFLRGLGFGGCLADDMGLGKTIQVLALLDARRQVNGDSGLSTQDSGLSTQHNRKDADSDREERRPSLVVVPRSLVFNWKAEAARFTPELRFLDHSTPDRIRDAGHFGEYDVVLTTYALLRKEAELFMGVEFDYAILDEAQAIKNSDSQAAKAALLLRARHRLALSGTPVENHLGELGSIFEFLNPGMLRAGSSRMSKMLRDAGGKVAEAANVRVMLSQAIRPFILRRTKTQVAPELPDRVEQTIWCELEPKQRKLYDELRDFYRASLLGVVATKGMNRSKIHILEALLRMRQAACHPGLVDEPSAKLDMLFEELPALIEGGQKVLVFSQFTSLLSLVRREMAARNMVYAYIDGASRDREAQVRRFQEDPNVPLFLISLKAGGLGLNLTAAEYVFLLDPWWNPAVEAQAIDRAHRIGQTRNVFAYRLVARDTIEEKILQLQKNKRALADAIISEENSILRQLTSEDLDLLLS
jgi:SNF2 family DNA or RNA helicase